MSSRGAHGRDQPTAFGDPTRRRWIAWFALCALAVPGCALVWWALPRSNQASLGQFAFKLAVFVVLAGIVALFPVPGRRVWWLGIVALFVFAGYLVPRVSGFYFLDTERSQGDAFYTHVYLLTYPAIVLTLAGTLRIGGSTSGQSLKTALSGIVILFSGFLDVMWQLVNPVTQIPATLAPPHITVITGGPISFTGVIWFAVAHIPLLILVLIAPVDRWLDRWLGPDPALIRTPGPAEGRHVDEGAVR